MNLETLKDRFFSERERLKKLHLSGETGFSIADGLKKALDSLLKPAFAHFFGGWDVPVACYALGGYGRGELNFHSDVDVNIIYDGKLTPAHLEDVEAFYYFLLSTRLDIGFAPRSLKEAVELSESDITIFTNMLQRRLLAGDRQLDRQFTEAFSKLVEGNEKHIVLEILVSRHDRYRRFYGTVYYQEPNVKESKGGLRDLHEAFWVSRIVYRVQDYSDLLRKKILDRKNFRDVVSAYDFLLKVRNHMHILSGRKSDILSFQMQKAIAKYFKFPATRKGIEQFMKNYFNSATDLAVITKGIIKGALEELEGRTSKVHIGEILLPNSLLDGVFYIDGNTLFVAEGMESKLLKDPKLVLHGFALVQDKGLELSAGCFSLFKLSAETNREGFRSKEAMACFKEILTKGKRLSYTLEMMHDTKVLGALIPEFERLRGHFQYDTYHKFTTDIHSILTLRELEKIEEKGTSATPVKEKQDLHQILQDLDNPHILYASALFHDVGKGKPGRHEAVGAELTRKYMAEMGFSPQEVEETAWLVRKHLRMSHLAFRRDISDPELLEHFKSECKTEDRLKKLFLLTYADIKAVGPGAWDKWKSALLWNLYRSTLALFTEEKSAEEVIEEKLRRRKSRVKLLLREKVDKDAVEEFFTKADRDYLITYPSDEIALHIKLLREMSAKGVEYITHHESFPDIGFTKLTIATVYRRGLFNKIAGILSYLGINIKGANINRAIKDGKELMVYTVHISTVAGEAVPCDKVESFKNLLAKLYAGEFSLKQLPPDIMKPKSFRRNVPLPENKVKVDNETSERYTIVEVSTYDRLGVLYAITKVLLEMNTRLRRAIITTEGNRVIDSFYITDISYKKITDKSFLERLSKKILSTIA